MVDLPKDSILLQSSVTMKYSHLDSTKNMNLCKQADDLIYNCLLNTNEDLLGICSSEWTVALDIPQKCKKYVFMMQMIIQFSQSLLCVAFPKQHLFSISATWFCCCCFSRKGNAHLVITVVTKPSHSLVKVSTYSDPTGCQIEESNDS